LGFNGDLYPTAGADVVMTSSGDMVKYQSGARARLGIGSANQLLQVKSSLPSWETVDLADTVLTTAGDVLFENATPELARLAAGTQYYNLQMGSALPAWAASSSSILTAAGDILYASGANTLTKLAKASDGDTLQLASGVPSWVTVSAGGATVTTQTIVPTGQTTTSTTPVGIDNTNLTLANRTNGKALWTMYVSGRNQTNGENMQLGVYFDGADQEIAATTSYSGGTNGLFTLATTHDLDETDIKGIWAVSSSTGQISSGGTANSQIHILEVS